MIKTIKDNIILQSPLLDETTKSGIFKGESILEEEKKVYTWLVLGVGGGVKEVIPGDKVFLRHGTHITKIVGDDGISYAVVSEHSVLAIEI